MHHFLSLIYEKLLVKQLTRPVWMSGILHVGPWWMQHLLKLSSEKLSGSALKNSLYTCTPNTASVVIVMSGNLIGMQCLPAEDVCVIHVSSHCKEPMPKLETNITRKGTATATVPISIFMCLWAIYIFLWSICLFCCRKLCGPILGKYNSLMHRHMNVVHVEIGIEAAQFPGKEYINGIFVSVQLWGKELLCSVTCAACRAMSGNLRFLSCRTRAGWMHHTCFLSSGERTLMFGNLRGVSQCPATCASCRVTRTGWMQHLLCSEKLFE